MKFNLVRTDDEIDELYDMTYESHFPGMSFEDGVKYTIEWLTSEDAPHPIKE